MKNTVKQQKMRMYDTQLLNGYLKTYNDHLNTLFKNDISENYLYHLYTNGSIDYYMYKILNYISTYKPTMLEYRKRDIYTHDMRKKWLLNRFKLYYKKSSNRITLHCYQQIKDIIDRKTDFNKTACEE